MNNNVRASVLASLLLVPATLASANEEVNPNDQSPVVQEGEQQPIHVLADETESTNLFNRFRDLNEATDINEFNSLKGLSEGLSDEFDEADINIILNKIKYIESIIGVTEKLKTQTLKQQIDLLTLTSPTLLSDVLAAKEEYENLMGELKSAQTDLNDVITNSKSVNKVTLTDKLTLLNNTDEQNITYIKTHVTNLDILTKLIKIKQFIDEYVETDKLTTFVKDTFATDIKNASDFYTALTEDEKKILASVRVKVGEEEVIPYKLLQDAQVVKKAVDHADAIFETIKSTTSAKVFKSKVTELQKAIEAVGEHTHLMQNEKTEVENYLQVIKVINGIDALVPSTKNEYREQVRDLISDYDAILTPNLQNFVTNHKNLLEAKANIEAVEKVEALIKEITVDNVATTLKPATDAYNALTATQKKIVNNYDSLQVMQKNNTSANSVVKLIDGIKPSLSSAFVSKVNAARLAYEKLGNKPAEGESDSQKLVTNIRVLETLEQFTKLTSKVIALKIPKATEGDFTTYKADVSDAYKLASEIDISTVDFSTLPDATKTALEKLLADAKAKISVAQEDINRADQIIAAINELKSTASDAAPLLERIAIARALYNEKYVAATATEEAKGTSANAKKLVYNIAQLTDLEKQYKTVMKVINDINTLPQYYGKTSLISRMNSIQKAYDKLGNNQQSVYNYNQLEKLAPVKEFITAVTALKTKDTDYEDKVKNLIADYAVIQKTFDAEEYAPLLTLLADKYYKKLTDATASIAAASTIIDKINQLKTTKGAEAGNLIEQINAEYKKVKDKALVTNYNDFKTIEKHYNAAKKVEALIAKIPAPTKANAKDYASKVIAADNAYKKLTELENIYVTNYTDVSSVLAPAKVMASIANLKVTSKNYLAELEAAQAAYDALSEIDQAKVLNAELLQEGATTEASVQAVMDLIKEAIPTAPDYMNKLVAARHAYNSLSKVEQKLVTNIKDLTDREKALKPVLSLIEEITKLDPANAKTFLSKYNSAMKAYEKLSFADRKLLTNEQRLITELAPIYNVMNQIAVIKQSSKTFVEDVAKARAAYNALTAAQKAQISNYSTLTDHELNVQGGAVVDSLIRAIKSSEPKDYIANVKAARTAYNALSSANKKAVTLLAELTAEEKYIKPVETVINLIAGLSNPRNNLSKQVASIEKAMLKLNDEQKKLITNMNDYTDIKNIVYVYDLIEKLKPSDKYYMGNLEAAQNAYGKLSAEDKQRVTNYYKLQEATTNIEGIQVVINIIAGLSSSSSTYFADIEKALEQYKALPSALKKQVVNYDALKLAEKNMKAAQKVMKQIEQIDPEVRSFESKVKAARKAYDKLLPEQKSLVSNYIFLTQYELELGL